jgi:hypothetical protein
LINLIHTQNVVCRECEAETKKERRNRGSGGRILNTSTAGWTVEAIDNVTVNDTVMEPVA